MNVYHGTSNEYLTDLLCTALDCICDPFNYYELTDEKKQGNPLNKHIMLLSYDAVKVRSIPGIHAPLGVRWCVTLFS